MRLNITWVGMLLVVFPLEIFADVYKFVDSEGHVYYSDVPKPGYDLIIKTPEPFSRPLQIDFGYSERDKARKIKNFRHKANKSQIELLKSGGVYEVKAIPIMYEKFSNIDLDRSLAQSV